MDRAHRKFSDMVIFVSLTLTVTPWVTHKSARIATPTLHYDFWEIKVSYMMDFLVSKF